MKQGSCPPPTYSQTNPVEPRGKYFRRNERDGVREGESGANAIEKFAHKATPTDDVDCISPIHCRGLSLPFVNGRIACALLSQTQSWREGGGMDDRGHWENIITCMRSTWKHLQLVLYVLPCLLPQLCISCRFSNQEDFQ